MSTDVMSLIDKDFESKINSFWFWADQFAVISNIENSDNWLINNFMNIRCHKKWLPGGIYFYNAYYYRDKMVDFYNCPFLKMYKVNRSECEISPLNRTSLIEFLKKQLENKRCVLFAVDRAKIKSKRKKDPHQILIHGINMNLNEVYYADNDSLTGKYTVNLKCSFNELIDAYFSFDGFFETDEPDFTDSIFVLQAIHDSEYSIDLYKIKHDICEYIYPSVENQNISYGINVVHDMISYLKTAEDCGLDFRGFSVLLDHKRAMLFRIEHLIRKLDLSKASILIDAYRQIEHNYKQILFLYLKFLANKDREILNTIISKLEASITEEVHILKEFIELL